MMFCIDLSVSGRFCRSTRAFRRIFGPVSYTCRCASGQACTKMPSLCSADLDCAMASRTRKRRLIRLIIDTLRSQMKPRVRRKKRRKGRRCVAPYLLGCRR